MNPEPKISQFPFSSLETFNAFLRLQHLPASPELPASLSAYWEALPWETKQASGLSLDGLQNACLQHQQLADSTEDDCSLTSLEVLAGFDKDRNPEPHNLRFEPGDVVCLVGPTGSGKSRFLADIECLAQGDTPTGRRIRINGASPETLDRFNGESGLVAQITQNMNFIMDLSADDFLTMHAESRGIENCEEVVAQVLQEAISMSGEPFSPNSQITQLSGGQSRSLMIADAAFLSPKPIVLIDEIENAGVDRNRALKLFIEKGKIVLLSTHDPILALSGHKRLIIANGAVSKVIIPDEAERRACQKLQALDRAIADARERLRRGERVTL
ncbi:ATP-binding cassette domain-containing protein [Pelagicoccus sp. SDUM812003]|uniref:ATP-binding cassette domain-containing protein n=1 Tax=Pelagicoccus sp. SDUM812003 TaxID=3041267 RepID=UPI00280E347B|nr:ATP-binding cassette domain-containing protein [Pelagicoccus sp. SDUM812003]MDQ8205098.1 ATP-binding cassette domain-containing protein [Pelagicoccus sp. SDUM812003]